MNNIELIESIDFEKEEGRIKVQVLLQGKDLHGFDANGPTVFDAIQNLMAQMKQECEDMSRVDKSWLLDAGKDRLDVLSDFFGTK